MTTALRIPVGDLVYVEQATPRRCPTCTTEWQPRRRLPRRGVPDLLDLWPAMMTNPSKKKGTTAETVVVVTLLKATGYR